MLKKFQHDRDIPELFNFDYGLWSCVERFETLLPDRQAFPTSLRTFRLELTAGSGNFSPLTGPDDGRESALH